MSLRQRICTNQSESMRLKKGQGKLIGAAWPCLKHQKHQKELKQTVKEMLVRKVSRFTASEPFCRKEFGQVNTNPETLAFILMEVMGSEGDAFCEDLIENTLAFEMHVADFVEEL